MKKHPGSGHPNLASYLEGFYDRVAAQVGVDVQRVIAVARGESRSQRIESALLQELRAILKQAQAEAQRGGKGPFLISRARARVPSS